MWAPPPPPPQSVDWWVELERREAVAWAEGLVAERVEREERSRRVRRLRRRAQTVAEQCVLALGADEARRNLRRQGMPWREYGLDGRPVERRSDERSDPFLRSEVCHAGGGRVLGVR